MLLETLFLVALLNSLSELDSKIRWRGDKMVVEAMSLMESSMFGGINGV